jgi:uncharacterized protein (TIGR02284 family)
MTNVVEKDIKQLNSFLRGELSAVETYEQCIAKMDDPSVVSQLQVLKESHDNRAILLKERIQQLGGEPSQSSGVWGSFTKALEGSASVFGASAAISVLEEGEDHGKNMYEKHVDDLSVNHQEFIRNVIYPEQKKSHDLLSVLEDRVEAR